MIGGCSCCSAQALVDIGDIEVICGHVKDVGYQRITESEPLEPGKGYWILLNNVADEATISVETVD